MFSRGTGVGAAPIIPSVCVSGRDFKRLLHLMPETRHVPAQFAAAACGRLKHRRCTAAAFVSTVGARQCSPGCRMRSIRRPGFLHTSHPSPERAKQPEPPFQRLHSSRPCAHAPIGDAASTADCAACGRLKRRRCTAAAVVSTVGARQCSPGCRMRSIRRPGFLHTSHPSPERAKQPEPPFQRLHSSRPCAHAPIGDAASTADCAACGRLKRRRCTAAAVVSTVGARQCSPGCRMRSIRRPGFLHTSHPSPERAKQPEPPCKEQCQLSTYQCGINPMS